MTSIPVNNVNALQSYGSQQPVVAGKQEEAVQESFQKVMGKITDEVTSLQGQTAGCASAGNVAAKKDSMEQGVKLQGTSGDKNRIKDASGQTTGQKSGKSIKAKGRENVREEEKQTICEDGEKLVQDVADEMNMTPEEVEAWLWEGNFDPETPVTVVAQTTCIRELFERAFTGTERV